MNKIIKAWACLGHKNSLEKFQGGALRGIYRYGTYPNKKSAKNFCAMDRKIVKVEIKIIKEDE